MNGNFSTPRRGFTVKDGKLYEFKRNSVTVSKAWPPVRYQKTRKEPFWHYTPIEKLSFCEDAICYSMNKNTCLEDKQVPDWAKLLSKFYDPIPLHVKEWMVGIHNRKQMEGRIGASDSWTMCAFFARCSEAAEIMRESPAIGYMLANLPVFRKDVRERWRTARRLLRKPRREILGYLGWPNTEAVAKILSKLTPGSCLKDKLLILRAVINRNSELIKPLTHIRRISSAILEIICHRRCLTQAGWRLVNEMDPDDLCPNWEAFYEFNDTLRMEQLLGLPASPINSIDHLKKRHIRAIKVLNKCDISKSGEKSDFPPPPVLIPPGSEELEIYPIDDPVKLCKEGMEQGNCASAYCEEVVRRHGNIYFYSIWKPERATLRIEKAPGNNSSYCIGEIKATYNRPASGKTVDAVNRWLSTVGQIRMGA